MDTTMEQQTAIDKALVPHAQRDMLHICPRVHGQFFDKPPFEEEILAFIHFLGHSAAIRTLTDTNAEIKNSKAYKEYYAITTGEAAPKPKASARRTRSSSDTSITPPSPRLIASAKGKQTAKASKAKSEDEGTGSKPEVLDVPIDELEEELSWNSTDHKGDDNEEKDDDSDKEDEGDDGEEGNGDDDEEFAEETRYEESFDPIPQTPKNSKDEGDGEEDLGLNIGEEERYIEEEKEEEDELYKDVNINQGRGLQASLEVEDSHVTLTLVNPNGMESIFKTTSQLDVPTPTSVASLPITASTMTPSTIATITTTSQAPILPTIVPSNIIQNLPSFGSLFRFDDRLRSLEVNFFEAIQTNQFAGAVLPFLRLSTNIWIIG
nr:hypothetical protein [Tanacetum cinerariifolium]